MEEILHQLICSSSHHLQVFPYIPGGCWGFLNHQQYETNMFPQVLMETNLIRHMPKCRLLVKDHNLKKKRFLETVPAILFSKKPLPSWYPVSNSQHLATSQTCYLKPWMHPRIIELNTWWLMVNSNYYVISWVNKTILKTYKSVEISPLNRVKSPTQLTDNRGPITTYHFCHQVKHPGFHHPSPGSKNDSPNLSPARARWPPPAAGSAPHPGRRRRWSADVLEEGPVKSGWREKWSPGSPNWRIIPGLVSVVKGPMVIVFVP